MHADLLIHDIATLYTMAPDAPELGRSHHMSVGFADGALCYLGPAADAPAADTVVSGAGRVALPGLVDCHTHAVWAGSRADEFRQRLSGTHYSTILEQGGGILNTVRHTRAASMDTLRTHARARLAHMRRRGVTTVEVKSGYGLTPAAELRMLQAARAAGDTVRVRTTFLGAHAVPLEHRADRAAYVREIIEEQLPLVAGVADAIDVYCDRGAFSLSEAVEILTAGKALGLGLRAHAEQVSHTGIAGAAAALGATCVDHLERIDPAGIAALARHGTVAVLLPGAQLYLKDPAPPVAALRAAGVPMAVATDLNPGSSPVHDLWTAATLSCVLQGLTIEEAALGITRNAGRALGCPELGWLGDGSVADLALFDPPPGEPPALAGLIQHMGRGPAAAVVWNGRLVEGAAP